MNHLDAPRMNVGLYSTQYEHLILIRDLNVDSKELFMQSFLKMFGLKNLIVKPTCCKIRKGPLV